MPLALKKRFLSFFFHLFRMTSQPHHDDLPFELEGFQTNLDKIPIQMYRSMRLEQYNSLERAKRLLVVSISLHKSSTSFQHEYVSVEVVDAAHAGTTYFLRLERAQHYVRDGSRRPSFSNSDPPSTPSLSTSSSSTTSLSTSSASITGLPALDTLCWLTGGTKAGLFPERACLTLAFDVPTLYFYHIVLLADTIHHLQPTYTLFSSNCFFFAGVLSKILEGSNDSVHVNLECLPLHMKKGSWFGFVKTFQRDLEFENELRTHCLQNVSDFEERIKSREAERELEAQRQQQELDARRQQQELDIRRQQQELDAQRLEAQRQQQELDTRHALLQQQALVTQQELEAERARTEDLQNQLNQMKAQSDTGDSSKSRSG